MTCLYERVKANTGWATVINMCVIQCERYKWHCYLPWKNNILTAVIPGTMTCSILEAGENLSCQTVKREPAFTNIFQNWLSAMLLQERERKKRTGEKKNRTSKLPLKIIPLPVYRLPLSKRRRRKQSKWKKEAKFLLVHCKSVGHKQMQSDMREGNTMSKVWDWMTDQSNYNYGCLQSA